MSWKRLLGGCVLFFGVAAHAAEKPISLDDLVRTLPRSDVSGQVTDHKGSPIEAAEVWLYYARGKAGLRDRLAGRMTTEANGAFAFKQAVVWEPKTDDDQDHEPHYSVIARHPDHGLYFANLFQGDSLDQVALVLTPRETRTVTVKDPNGAPVVGATVFICGGRLLRQDCEGKDRKYTYLRLNQDLGIVSEVTDDQGKATGTVLDGGYFLVTKPGYKKTWVPGSKAILFPGASVSGTVRYPDGSPAAGAAVWYEYHGNRLGWDHVTVADANGFYQFDHVAAAGFYYSWMNPDDEAGAQGSASVKADDLRVGSSLLSKKETFSINPGEHLEKDLTFAGSVTLSGKVIDVGTKQPVPHMGLTLLISTGQQYLDTKDVTVDADGRFSVHVAPGSEVRFSWEESRREGLYLMDEAWKQQGNYNPSFRQVVNEDVTGLVFNIKLVPLHPLTGQVVDEQGQGVAKASVYIHSDLPPAKADEHGTFSFKGVFEEKGFDLYAESSDQSAAGIMHMTAGSKEARIVLQTTQDYKGRVSSTDGLPAGDLKFYLDLKINDSTVYRVRREPKTNEKGQFDVKNLCPEGRYYAWWSSDNEDNRDYDYGNADIDLTRLSEGAMITFQAKQYLNVIMGTVEDEQGQPITKARIRFKSYDLMQQSERQKQIVIDESGSFEIPRLAPGTASLLISAQGYVSKNFQVPTDTIDFEAVLPNDTGKRKIQIKVLDANAPMADVPVQFYTCQYRKKAYSDRKVEQTDCRTNAQGVVELSLELDTETYGYDRLIVACDVAGYDLAYLGFPANEDVDATLAMKKSQDAWWEIQVEDQSGLPVPAARASVVTVQFEGRPQAAFFRSYPEFKDKHVFEADDDGRIKIARFNLADSLSLNVSAPGYAMKNHWVSKHQPARTKVQLPKGGLMKGKVVYEGGPLPEGLKVYANQENGNASLGPEPIGEHGIFTFDSCAPGKYTITLLPGNASDKGAFVFPKATVVVKEDAEVEVVLELEIGTLVSGEMVDKKTGQTPKDLAGLYVTVFEANIRAGIEEDGTWKLYLPEGHFVISYRYQNATHTFKTLDVKKGEPVENLIIEIE